MEYGEKGVPIGSKRCSRSVRRVAGRHKLVACATQKRLFKHAVNEQKEEATMKTLKCGLLLVLVISVGVSTVMLLTRSPRPLDIDANEPNQAVEQNEVVDYQSAPLRTVPVRLAGAERGL